VADSGSIRAETTASFTNRVRLFRLGYIKDRRP
jgi:hypothetical protein